jgi:hypothetical protein
MHKDFEFTHPCSGCNREFPPEELRQLGMIPLNYFECSKCAEETNAVAVREHVSRAANEDPPG